MTGDAGNAGRAGGLGDVASVLATALSDAQVLAGGLEGLPADTRVSAARADVHVHMARGSMFDLDRPVDPRDPFVKSRRQFTPSPRGDLDAVEDALFDWMDGGADRPARFAQNPAAVMRNLSRLDPRVGGRVAAVLGSGSAPASRLAGLAVDQLTVDTIAVDDDPAPASHEPQQKETTAADAVLELGLDQLARILDNDMVPGVRNRASHIAFDRMVSGQLQRGVLSLLLEEASDPRLALDAGSPGTLDVTIGFPEATVQLVTGPLGSSSPVSVGAVEISARLTLQSHPRGDAGTTVALELVPGSIAISVPEALDAIPLPLGVAASVRQDLWDAATAAAMAGLAPFYSFAVPLTFDTMRCDIGARGVTPAFRRGSATTTPSLALFMTLLGSGATPPPTDEGPSLVPDGTDGHLLLSNRLVLELACCLLTQSDVWGNLPDQPTEAPTDASPCCRWRDIADVSVGEERFDTLKLLEICAEDGLRMYVDLRKSGWGWSARVQVTATATLRLDGGVVRVDVDTQVKIDTSVAWWLKVVAVLAVLGGLVLIVVGILTGNAAAIGSGGALVVLGLGLWTLAQLLPPDIRLPTPLDDTDAILDLLPGGLREKLGAPTFLTDAAWDDVSLAGYMTVPGEPPPLTGGEVALAPGQALDLDTGEVVNADEVGLRLDIDLRLHAGLEDSVVSAPLAAPARGPGVHDAVTAAPVSSAAGRPLGPGSLRAGGFQRPELLRRTVAAAGSSRIVGLAGRPYAAVAESDLRGITFPASATAIGVPGRGSTPVAGAAVFAARSSAGRLAKGLTWTDAEGITWVRFRTYDTPLLVTVVTSHSTQDFGKPGVTDITTILNARFQAVPAGAWADGRPLTYQWFWQGAPLNAMGTIDGGARFTVVDDRCAIDTLQGVDLNGAVCVVATHTGGFSVTSCRNVFHLGRIPHLPGSGPGGPGRPGHPGVPGHPGGPGGPGGP